MFKNAILVLDAECTQDTLVLDTILCDHDSTKCYWTDLRMVCEEESSEAFFEISFLQGNEYLATQCMSYGYLKKNLFPNPYHSAFCIGGSQHQTITELQNANKIRINCSELLEGLDINPRMFYFVLTNTTNNRQYRTPMFSSTNTFVQNKAAYIDLLMVMEFMRMNSGFDESSARSLIGKYNENPCNLGMTNLAKFNVTVFQKYQMINAPVFMSNKF